VLLLANPDFLRYCVDGLLLNPDHPRANLPTSMLTWLQKMHTECLAQLAVFPQGRDALLADAAVVKALRQVQDGGGGLSEECRELAGSALLALCDAAQEEDPAGAGAETSSCDNCTTIVPRQARDKYGTKGTNVE
jgi:hypothetical protein